MKKLWSFQTGFSLFALVVICMVLFDHVCGVEPTRRPNHPVAQPEAATAETAQAAADQPSDEAAPTDGVSVETAIRSSVDAFVKVFNQGDAQAVAALWTPEGEYIDDSGRRFNGRDEIEAEYAKFFAAHPGAKIEIKIDAIRSIGLDTAIEDGHASLVPHEPGSPASTPYTVIHSRVDGRWLMASVREPAAQSAANPLESLDWLVGSWHAATGDTTMDVSYRWIANRSFLERTYTVETKGQVTASGVQLIGQDAGHAEIQSWDFDSDAGYAVGNWIPEANGWTVVTRGKLADSQATSAVTDLTRVNANTLAWQSRERKVGGRSLPDTDEIRLLRDAVGE